MSDLPWLSALNAPETLQLSDCVVDDPLPAGTPLDEFAQALTALNRTASLMTNVSQPDVIAEMVIVALISSAESYFRHLFAAMASHCPLTQGNVAGSSLTYGTVRSYPTEVAALALLDGVQFSTAGVLTKEMRRFTRYEVKKESDLAAAIDSFEAVCRIRHAAAHWRGYLDARAVLALGVLNTEARTYRLSLSFDLVQRAFAVCDYLVRLVNRKMYEQTVRQWVGQGVLVLDEGSIETDLIRCEALLQMFGHSSFCQGLGREPAELLDELQSWGVVR